MVSDEGDLGVMGILGPVRHTLILDLLMLQQLLLSGIQLLQRMSMRVDTRRHPAH